MTSVEPSAVCTRIQQHISTLRFQLQQLEDGVEGGGGGVNGSSYRNSQLTPADAAAAEEEARASLIQNLNATFHELSILDRSINENGGVKKDYFRKKSASLSNDALDLRRAIERYLKTTYASRQERRERDALFSGGRSSRGGNENAVAVDAYLQERAHLSRSHAVMDDITSAAENVMGSLRSQRTMIKGVHKKVLDLGSSLGVSNTMMKIIERRTIGDKVLVYGGMVFLTLLLWLVVTWGRS